MLGGCLRIYLGFTCKKESSKFILYSVRNLCDVTRKKRTKKTANISSKISNNKDSENGLCTEGAGENVSLQLSDTLRLKEVPSSNILITNSVESSQATEKVKKHVKKKEIQGLENLKKGSDSSKANANEPLESSLDHFGSSLKRPGMKPFSVLKKKVVIEPNVTKSVKAKKTTPSEKQETVETKSLGLQAVQIEEDKEKLDFNDSESVDLAEVIPKIRAPSIQRVQNLDIPPEWLVMDQSWTPSPEFLDSILSYPIDGLKKATFCQGNTDFVNSFVTGDKSVKMVPAVTTVLSKTMSPSQAFALSLWRKRSIAQMGEEAFLEHTKRILTRGKQFHDTIQRYLLGEPVQSLSIENLPLITNCWKSLVPFLNRIDDVIAVESEVLHPQLLYRGVVDCIVEIRGQPFIVEWKHSSRKRTQIQQNYDSPVQLMAYKGAINANVTYPFGVKNSLLVVAYDDGSPASVFHLPAPQDGGEHWHSWLRRLHTFWILQKAGQEVGEK